MRNHTLMQTIARANRVWRDKESGLIVDYVGIFRNLERALAIYGTAQAGGASPARDKAEPIRQLREAIAEAAAFCQERGVDPARIRDAQGFEREGLKDDAVAALVATDDTRAQYLNLARKVEKLFRSLLPDVRADEFGPLRQVFRVLADKIRSELPPPDISGVMDAVEGLLDRSIAAEGYVIRPSSPATST